MKLFGVVLFSVSVTLKEGPEILIPGKRLETSISWPAQLDDKCQLKLVARGRVARLEHGRVGGQM